MLHACYSAQVCGVCEHMGICVHVSACICVLPMHMAYACEEERAKLGMKEDSQQTSLDEVTH
jgi:hypothetical protein